MLSDVCSEASVVRARSGRVRLGRVRSVRSGQEGQVREGQANADRDDHRQGCHLLSRTLAGSLQR